MKTLITAALCLITLHTFAQDAIKIKINTYERSRKVGTAFQVVGLIAMAATGVAVMNNLKQAAQTDRNPNRYILSSCGIFTFGAVIKIDANRTLRRQSKKSKII